MFRGIVNHMHITDYKTYVFDCDGVLLDSNKIKSQGFYDVTLKYGKESAEKFLYYHKQHGGISRFEKFKYFFTDILEMEVNETEYQELLYEYGNKVLDDLMQCELTTSMQEFLRVLPKDCTKIIVSGGMQIELRHIFEKRKMATLFDGIYGSPDTKRDILKRELNEGRITYPAVFFGDSLLDYQVAKAFDMDFVFLSEYTEFGEWERFFDDKPIQIYRNFSVLLESQKV